MQNILYGTGSLQRTSASQPLPQLGCSASASGGLQVTCTPHAYIMMIAVAGGSTGDYAVSPPALCVRRKSVCSETVVAGETVQATIQCHPLVLGGRVYAQPLQQLEFENPTGKATPNHCPVSHPL